MAITASITDAGIAKGTRSMMFMLVAAAVAAMPTVPAADAAPKAAVIAYNKRCETEWAQGVVKFQP